MFRILKSRLLTSACSSVNKIPNYGSATSRCWLSSAAPQREVVQVLRLNNLHDNPGAVKQKRRVGRGIGSSKGKTCGRGHKGQKARSGFSMDPTFEGGQTKFFRLLPKRGFNNKRHATDQVPVNLDTVQNYIAMGRLDATKPITIRDMQLAGMFKANAVKHGVKLLAYGKDRLQQPIHLVVNRASASAIQAVERHNGQVTTIHLNRLALRSVLRPEKFETSIRHARPPPKWQPYYTNWKNRGYLNPMVQMQNWLQSQDAEMQAKFEAIRKQQEEAEGAKA